MVRGLLSSGGERIKQTDRTYILHGTFPVAVDEIQNTHQTRSVPLNLPRILQNQKEKKKREIKILTSHFKKKVFARSQDIYHFPMG